MKMDQLAFYCANADAELAVKRMLGLEHAEWIKDTVTAEIDFVNGYRPYRNSENVAELQFNYSLGMELEIMRYINGDNWHDINPLKMYYGNEPFIGHVGFHLEEGEDFPNCGSFKLVQEVHTVSHINPLQVESGRRYHYRIYELSPGSYVKYIKRIHK